MSEARYASIVTFVSLSSVIIAGDFSLLSVALPSIGSGLRASPDTLSMIAATSTLVFASCLVLGGRLADLFGQVRCSTIGLALYVVGALLSASAISAVMLIGGRALQGVGCALLSPASFSLLNTALPAGPIRNRGYGVYAASQGAALIIGSGAGGLVTTLLGWRAAFLVNIPIAVASIVLALRTLPLEPPEARRRSVDVAGAALVALGGALLLWSLSIMGRRGLLSIEGLMAFAGGLAAFSVLYWRAKSLPDPLIPASLFRAPNVISSCIAMICVMAASAGMFIVPNLYMQRILGLSAAQSGFGMIPQALAAMLTGRLIITLLARYSLRTNILLGISIFLAGLLLFPGLWLLFPAGGYLGTVLPPLLLCALGSLLPTMALMAGITLAVPPNLQGVGSAAAMMCQQMGLTLGITLVLTVAASTEQHGVPPGTSLGCAFLAAAAVAALGMFCILLFTKRYERPLAAPAVT
jgi:MFS family permease